MDSQDWQDDVNEIVDAGMGPITPEVVSRIFEDSMREAAEAMEMAHMSLGRIMEAVAGINMALGALREIVAFLDANPDIKVAWLRHSRLVLRCMDVDERGGLFRRLRMARRNGGTR